MIGVSGATARYRTAITELPLRARVVEQLEGAIVVVDGAPGWPARSRVALQGRASALLIAHPVAVDDDELAALEAAAGSVPVVLDRPWLRADLVADAAAPRAGVDAARPVTVDTVAIPGELGAMVRESLGWLRMLAGGELELRAAAAVPHGLLALLEEPVSGRAATLTASTLVGRGGARLRAQAVGETRLEIDLDAATDARSVDVSTAEGTLRRPRRRESSARVALRRAIDAISRGDGTGDLRAFRHDAALAASVFSAG
ncbi:hypothetical protein [Microbacterium sp. W4I20]|uniref:hypothetical protein n=1 Tax=Microbacterium sp. W4I20 TaxID=3042262 RepID=UPI002788F388|nr:hypothetical protein [Microbacterium sp. W4I20]MDQ0726559.1 hypothetical protein [Microbacterium sp. W4I20]